MYADTTCNVQWSNRKPRSGCLHDQHYNSLGIDADIDADMADATGKATTAAAAAAAAATRQQEDAQEFLGFLLDSAHQELLRLRTLHAHSLSDFGERVPSLLSPMLRSLPSASVSLYMCPRWPRSVQAYGVVYLIHAFRDNALACST